MTRSNRVLNRILIFLVGLVAIATGLVLELSALGIDEPAVATPTNAALWIALSACVIVIVLCLLWITTRGRGRTSQLLTLTDETGTITIDTRVAADLLTDALHGNPDVRSVGSGSWRMRGTTVLSLRLVTSRRTNLPTLIESVGRAVDDLDGALERRVPVLLQIVSGLSVREVRTR